MHVKNGSKDLKRYPQIMAAGVGHSAAASPVAMAGLARTQRERRGSTQWQAAHGNENHGSALTMFR